MVYKECVSDTESATGPVPGRFRDLTLAAGLPAKFPKLVLAIRVTRGRSGTAIRADRGDPTEPLESRSARAPAQIRSTMPHDPREFFDAAFDDFLEVETPLIETGVSERSLCARLLLHLDRQRHRDRWDLEFRHYFVDADYNRMQNDYVKRMWRNGEAVTIQCDVLVHSRTQPDNLIAIEMKKSTEPLDDRNRDRERLTILTSQPGPLGVRVRDGVPDYVCGYALGLYLELNEARRNFLIEEYRDGRLAREPEHRPF
jgi:hypothetical protein